MDVLFIYSGKGGVGKSTFAVNLAYSLPGLRVGLFDADFEGPSIPTMVSGVEEESMVAEGLGIHPGTYAGIRISSSGLIENNGLSRSLSGKYLEGALDQLLIKARWDVDLLIVDMPPGTSEIHHQLLRLLQGRCLLITTPQTVSFADTQKGIDLIRRMEVPLLGIVENMSQFQCECCGHSTAIFSGDTHGMLAVPNGLQVLDTFPIIPEISARGNEGIPFVLANPEHPVSTRMAGLGSQLVILLTQKFNTWSVH